MRGLTVGSITVKQKRNILLANEGYSDWPIPTMCDCSLEPWYGLMISVLLVQAPREKRTPGRLIRQLPIRQPDLLNFSGLSFVELQRRGQRKSSHLGHRLASCASLGSAKDGQRQPRLQLKVEALIPTYRLNESLFLYFC